MIPYSKQSISKNDVRAVLKVLRSNFLTQGINVPTFEKKLSNYCKSKFAVVTNSATSALHIACLSLGLKKKDYLWTVPNTFVASANCALYCQAKLDFVDIDPNTYNISIKNLEQKLINAKKTRKIPKVLVVVHFGGNPCDLEKIHSLSKKYKFKVIEDASHALGATYKNKNIGNCNYSDVTVFSFHPVKSITTAEGGAAMTNNNKLYESMMMFRSHGITKNKKKFIKKNNFSWYFEQQKLGYNYRLNEIEAVLGISQLKSLKKFIRKRRKIANFYNNSFKNLPIKLPTEKSNSKSSYHLYTLKFKNKNRDKIYNYLKKKNIGVNVHYIPVLCHPYYQKLGYDINKYPVSLDFYKNSLSIPIYPDLKRKDQLKIIKWIKKII